MMEVYLQIPQRKQLNDFICVEVQLVQGTGFNQKQVVGSTVDCAGWLQTLNGGRKPIFYLASSIQFLKSMADKHVNIISLKALVDEGSNRVVFAELDKDLIDVLFSFLTMPMGTIIRLTRNQPPAVDIGCMNNLYESVENFDVQCLRPEACKTMLLCPRSGLETYCRSLKLKIDDAKPDVETTRYFVCSSDDWECTTSEYKLLSHHREVLCSCGLTLSYEVKLSNIVSKKSISDIRDGGVFVKGLTRLLLSDDLHVMPPSTAASLSLLSNLGIMDASTIEERTFAVGVDEVLNLLKCSLVSKTPLTETLLKHNPVPQLSENDFNQGSSIQSQMEPEASNGDEKIDVKIIVSKSKKVVFYAEAREDFVDLLFSFLTLLLGYIVKEMRGSSSKGCVDHLYMSVQDLDSENYMKSDKHKAILVSPKVVPGFRYENQPLDSVEASHPTYYMDNSSKRLTTDKASIPSGNSVTVLTVKDPESHYKEVINDGGFMDGPAMFTVTDNLVVTPISPASGVSILKKLNVPFNDVEERVVRVGDKEALRLLVASFVTENALTNAFIQRVPKQE